MKVSTHPTFRFMVSRPQHLIALSFGAGLAPVWPGTVGTIIGFGLYAGLQSVPSLERAVVYLLLFAIGAWCSNATGQSLGQQDHRSIVWDETVGMSLVLELIPGGLVFWMLGFLLFRAFDALKPWPIYLAHNATPNGFWVMFDDLLASVYTVLSIWLLARLFDRFF